MFRDELECNGKDQQRGKVLILTKEVGKKWKVSFSQKKSGLYSVQVLFNGAHAEGSPFFVELQPGPVDVTKCQMIFVDQVTVGKRIPYLTVDNFPSQIQLKVDILDKFGNATTADLHPFYIEQVCEFAYILSGEVRGVPLEVSKGHRPGKFWGIVSFGIKKIGLQVNMF